jgi:dienelactone hydrolase
VSRETLDQVVVPVEAIDGPILLLAGGDDRQWPTVPVAALTIDRLRQADHPHPYGLRVHCNAGHVFTVPYADYTGRLSSDQYGGTPRANARAAADAWPSALDYLGQAL